MNRIDPNDKLYLEELLTQCEFAIRALTYTDLALNNKEEDINIVWYHIQMFLVSVGNVSKMLYSNPYKKQLQKYVAHHSRIVEKYELPKLNLKDELKLRNYYEHYDEKLVDWLEKTPPNVAKALNNIAPLDNFIQGIEFSYLKHLDNSSETLYLLERSINIPETFNKLLHLEQHIQSVISKDQQRNNL